MPAPAVAGLFLAALISLLFSNYYRLSAECSAQERLEVENEVARIEGLVSTMIHYKPQSAAYLPDLSFFRFCVTRQLKHYQPFRRPKRAITDAVSLHLYLVAKRAKLTGFQDQLHACMAKQRFTSPMSDQRRLFSLFQEDCFSYVVVNSFAFHFFATSQNRHLGVGHRSIRAGDQIWLLNGAQAPFILRPKSNGNFEHLGEAYVQGIMLGEARRENAVDGGQDREIFIE